MEADVHRINFNYSFIVCPDLSDAEIISFSKILSYFADFSTGGGHQILTKDHKIFKPSKLLVLSLWPSP